MERPCAAPRASRPRADIVPAGRVSLLGLRKVGEGQFGEVWIGKLDEKLVPAYLCAVKVEKTNDDFEAPQADSLEREAALMAQVPEHVNLVSLIGVVTSGTPTLLLVSYCENGSLLKYANSTAPSPPTSRQNEARYY